MAVPGNVPDGNRGLAEGQEQVWGFGLETAIDNIVHLAPGARVFFVDPNNAQATDAGNAGRDPTVPLATVDAAVTLCRDHMGDTIVVGANDAWQYSPGNRGTIIHESLVIPATKGGIRIVGAAPTPMGVCWEADNAGEACITVYAVDVLIEGFCFTGNISHGCDGIYAEWDGATLYGENLTVRNCVFDDAIDTAIQLEYSWYCQIYGCYFEECDEYGIYVDPAGSGIAFCQIHDNILRDCTLGNLYLRDADQCEIYRNQVWNSLAQSAAAATDLGITTEDGRENFVHHNVLSCVLPAGAPGDYDDYCTASTAGGGADDAWIENYCMNGPSVTNPT